MVHDQQAEDDERRDIGGIAAYECARALRATTRGPQITLVTVAGDSLDEARRNAASINSTLAMRALSGLLGDSAGTRILDQQTRLPVEGKRC